jgi:hypothetical protein
MIVKMDFLEGANPLYLYGGSFFYDQQIGFTNSLAAVLNAGASFGIGSEYDLLLFQFPLGITLLWESLKTDSFAIYIFGTAGGNIALTRMTFDVPVALNVIDPTTVQTTMFTGLLSGGIQTALTTGDFVISPFALWSYSGGLFETTQTSAMSYTYPSISGKTDNILTTVYGFDILHSPSDISLSSQLRYGKSYWLFTTTLRFLLSKKEAS